MNEVKRYKAVINDKPYKPYAYCEESSDGIYVRLEDYTALQQQLTATTNSLTNALEALKSAGIDADTVQAGVMQLKTRLEALAVENDLIHSNPSLASMMDALDKFYEHEHLPETGMLAAYKTLLPKRSPATEAYLNAVRADAVEDVAKRLYGHGYNFGVLTRFAAHLRAGNAGKDGSHE